MVGTLSFPQQTAAGSASGNLQLSAPDPAPLQWLPVRRLLAIDPGADYTMLPTVFVIWVQIVMGRGRALKALQTNDRVLVSGTQAGGAVHTTVHPHRH